MDISKLASLVMYSMNPNSNMLTKGYKFQFLNDDVEIYSTAEINTIQNCYRIDGQAVTSVSDFANTLDLTKIIGNSVSFNLDIKYNAIRIRQTEDANRNMVGNELQIWVIRDGEIENICRGSDYDSVTVYRGGNDEYESAWPKTNIRNGNFTPNNEGAFTSANSWHMDSTTDKNNWIQINFNKLLIFFLSSAGFFFASHIFDEVPAHTIILKFLFFIL